jgi:hypothetical protein
MVSVILSLSIIITLVSQVPVLAQNFKINLIHKQFIWKPYSAAILSQNDTDLSIVALTNTTEKLWNRGYLPIQLNYTNGSSILFNLEYASLSDLGNATFLSEVRDNVTNSVLWSSKLTNTNGQLSNNTFALPGNMLNKPVEFRLYIITNETGQHNLDVKNASLTIR